MVKRRYALHMKPGHGATIEGLLVGRTRRSFVLINAEMLETPERTQEMRGT